MGESHSAGEAEGNRLKVTIGLRRTREVDAGGRGFERDLSGRAPVIPRCARPGFRIAETQISPTQIVPWHFHNEVQGTFYVIAGTIHVFTPRPEGAILLSPGETYSARPRQPIRSLMRAAPRTLGHLRPWCTIAAHGSLSLVVHICSGRQSRQNGRRGRSAEPKQPHAEQHRDHR